MPFESLFAESPAPGFRMTLAATTIPGIAGVHNSVETFERGGNTCF
jgi:hypothetical protein